MTSTTNNQIITKPINVMWGQNSIISENCVWLTEGYRRICISYEYTPHTGYLCYAACIYKSRTKQWSEEVMNNCASTTIRRYNIRPVKTFINEYIDYSVLINTIRYLMCHKFGCKGVRTPKRFMDNNMDTCSNSSTSTSSNEYITELDSVNSNPNQDTIEEYTIEEHMRTLDINKYTQIIVDDINKKNLPIFYSKYFHSDNYKKYGYHRAIYITFKGDPITGDLLYTACINSDYYPSTDIGSDSSIKDDRNHFNTAFKRLNKKPVYLNIPTEFRHQLSNNTPHYEDITYIIVSNILDRKKGRFQITN